MKARGLRQVLRLLWHDANVTGNSPVVLSLNVQSGDCMLDAVEPLQFAFGAMISGGFLRVFGPRGVWHGVRFTGCNQTTNAIGNAN